jgi:hypothetical protein
MRHAMIAAMAFGGLFLQAQSSSKHQAVPRTPDGRPDLQGIWTNVTRTPLERPDEFRGKTVFTEQEASAFEHRVVTQGNRDRRDADPEADVAAAYNELFFDQGDKLSRIGGRIPTSIIFDPPDGRIPALTPEGKARIDAAQAYARLHPADRAQDRSLAEQCIYWRTAGPPMLPGPYNNLYQIYQTGGTVTILSEMIHETRIVPLDGRPHVSSAIRLWTGDPRGHWDGDTLVIETTNFNDKTRFRGASEHLKVTERLTRVDAKTILYRFTVDDPSTFTKPWSGELALVAAPGPIFEYACHEGNQALTDILAGARAAERGSK